MKKVYVPPPAEMTIWTIDNIGNGVLFSVVVLLGIFAFCVTP